MISRLKKFIPQITKLCKTYNVKSLYVFGSVLNKDFHKDSDIDLIVDFEGIKLEDYADNYFDFKFSLERIFNRNIDLLEEKAIKNPYFKLSVDQKKLLVYGH